MAESMQDYEKELNASFRKIGEGDILTGTVIGITEDEVTLDLKYYTQGVIKVADLSNDPQFSVFEDVHEGDEIEATVVRMDDGQGNILLSRKEANEVLAWEKLQQMMDEKVTVTVRIREAVNAGVTTYLEGIRAFIPASHLALDYVEDTSAFVGKELEVRIITVDAERKKLVLSHREVAREEQIEERNHKIAMIAVGTVMEGTVESLQPYGAFVNIGNGLSGLVHVSQICEKRISSPGEVLKEGQQVKVKVTKVQDGKISLSMKALQEEMIDTQQDVELEKYQTKESASTSLGDLLSKLNLS
ncbi:MAG: S1 RNA-binding domain-containing protein [Lachnospiraceae bacterium]|nr:S1 RNA-binding domain-containing protein [Lachnospiraceae bacterium]